MPQHFFQRTTRIVSILLMLSLLYSPEFPLMLRTLELDKLAHYFSLERVYAAVGDLRIQYGSGTNATPQTRFYTNSSNTFGSPTATVAGTANVGWTVSKESPTEDITVVATQSTTGVLDVFCRDASGVWSKDFTVTIGANAATRRFDIEFEKTSGIPMVLYSRNVATTNELGYRRKTGAGCGAGTWTAESTINPTVVTGIVLWVEMEARQTSGTNVLAAAFSDANATQGGKLEAMIWNGSWGNESPVGAANGWSDLSIELQGTTGANAAKVFDLAFETLSGDLIIGWGTSVGANNTNGWRYATCAATLPCTWSGVQTPAGPTDDATMVDAAPDPGSDAVAFIGIGNAGSDLTAWRWSGSAVSGAVANADTSALASAAGLQLVGIDWVVSGSQRMAVGVYANNTTGYRYIYYDTVGAAWRTDSNGFVVPGTPATAGKHILVRTNPDDNTQLLLGFSDVNADLWAKRLDYDGAAGGGTTVLSTWSNADAGTALETTVSSITSMPFWFDWVKGNSLLIGVTAGSKATSLASGDVNQYAHDTSCTSAANCAAFTLGGNSSAVTVSSIKVTETGTVDANADLSNFTLFYDTDGNWSDAGPETQYNGTPASFDVSQAGTANGSLILTPGTTYYFYVRFDVKSGTPTYPKGGQTMDFQIASNADVTFSSGSATISGAPQTLAGTTNVTPNATGVTFGTGLSDGARSGESVTISGFGFGSAPGGSRANCAGGVDTGCVRFVVGGNATVLDADISAWSNTSITFSVNSAIATYGGASGLEVVAGSQSDVTNLTYYIYPNVTGMTTCASGGVRDSACGTNAAEEYASGDTFGLIQLSGDHFNIATGTISFTGGFGAIAGTVHSVVEGPCTVSGWGSTGTGGTVCVEVAPSISDSVYDGFVTLTRSGDSKTDAIDLHILPRITSAVPANGVVGDTIAINGNHFCQTGTCPPVPPTSDYIAYFGSTQPIAAEFVTTCSGGSKWSDTQVCVKVPVGVPAGSQNIKIRGKASPVYESEREAFTVNTTVPSDPANLRQYKSDNTTLLTEGVTTPESTVILKADITGTLSINMALQVEVKPATSAFDGTGIVEGTAGGGGACMSCTSLANARVTISGISDGTKQWRARVRNTTTNEFSNWLSFGVNPDGSTDFRVDTTPPAITNVSSGSPGSNSATVTWDTSGENSTSQVQYNKTGIFVSNCATNSDCTTLDSTPVFSHSALLSNLDSGTLYYYRVRSQDAIGNEASSTVNMFTTGSVTQPAKTTTFYLLGRTGILTGGSTSSTTFSVLAPETTPTVKSAFVVVTGISASGGTNNVSVQVNNQSVSSYVIDASSQTPFTLVYNITPATLYLNDNPQSNVLRVIPSIDTSITSAKVVVTYAYTP
jgi:hypothetical protein